jgi:hypothetical protein
MHDGCVMHTFLQIPAPNPSNGSGTPWGDIQSKLAPLISGGWGTVLFILIPFVLIAGLAFWLIGGLSGNSKGVNRGRAILFSIPIGLFAMVIVRITGNWVINS